MIKKHEKYNRELACQEEGQIDETKKPIQESRNDKENRFKIQNPIPIDMINFDYET